MKIKKSLFVIKTTDDGRRHPETLSLEEAINYNFMKNEIITELYKSKTKHRNESPLASLLIASLILFLSVFL